MDITLARTFLEIVATGRFQRAAERLHVTQTAVSARVRALEELLGRPLFVRNKSGASLTPAGEQFSRYASTLVQVWERARHQVAVPTGRQGVLTVGSEQSLWDPSARLVAAHAHGGAAPGLANRGRRFAESARPRRRRRPRHRHRLRAPASPGSAHRAADRGEAGHGHDFAEGRDAQACRIRVRRLGQRVRGPAQPGVSRSLECRGGRRSGAARPRVRACRRRRRLLSAQRRSRPSETSAAVSGARRAGVSLPGLCRLRRRRRRTDHQARARHFRDVSAAAPRTRRSAKKKK